MVWFPHTMLEIFFYFVSNFLNFEVQVLLGMVLDHLISNRKKQIQH